jgi:hypothetical protein
LGANWEHKIIRQIDARPLQRRPVLFVTLATRRFRHADGLAGYVGSHPGSSVDRSQARLRRAHSTADDRTPLPAAKINTLFC